MGSVVSFREDEDLDREVRMEAGCFVPPWGRQGPLWKHADDGGCIWLLWEGNDLLREAKMRSDES